MTTLRRGLKALNYLARTVATLCAIAFAWLVAVNWVDDPLSDAAKQILQYTPPTEQSLAGNGFLIVAGLDAAAEGDLVDSAYALGQKRLTRSIERRDWALSHYMESDGMPPEVAGAPQTQLPSNFVCPTRTTTDCLAWYQAQPNAVDQLLDQHHALLTRYAAAALAPQFNNQFAFDLTYSTPSYKPTSQAHTLLLAKAAVQWPLHPTDALDTFTIASSLSARLGHNANSVADAWLMLSLRYKEIAWLSNAVATTSASTPAAISAHLSQLLSQPTFGLQSAFRGESQYITALYYVLQQAANGNAPDLPESKPSWWRSLYARFESIGYLPDATLNQSVANFAQLEALASLPATALQPALDRWLAQHDDEQCGPWYGLRNWVGQCLLTISPRPSYIQRAHDVDGYRRLALLQQQALAQHITAANMPAWLAQSPPALRNPYNLEPMQWDADTNSLVFEGKERQSQNPDGSATYRVPLRLPVQP